MITFQGQTKSIAEWAAEIGIGQNAVRWRLSQGWPLEKVLQTREEAEKDRAKKISATKTGVPQTASHRAANGAARKGKPSALRGTTKSPEIKEKISKATKKAWDEGRLSNKDGLAIGQTRSSEERAAAWTPEKRAAQGQKTLQAYKDGRMEIHGRYKGRWTVYEGIKGAINMRSKSETLFAYHLDKIGMDWLFEPKRFDLGWATYTPDFYLPSIDLWIEVKGSWTEDSKRKFDEFGKDYPVMAVRAHDLLNFEKKYPH